MTTSQTGIDLIKRFEGCNLTAYQDPAGVWTIGYGSVAPEIATGMTITQDEAESMLLKHLDGVDSAMADMIKVPVNQSQWDALADFTYNLGAENLKSSTLLLRLNQSNYAAASEQFSRWVFAGGQILPGLVARRKAEQELFLGVIGV